MNLLKLDITTGPVVIVAYGLSLALILVLLVRAFIPWRIGRVFWNIASATIGAAVAYTLMVVLFVWLDVFDGPLELRAIPWLIWGFAALGLAIRSFWLWRRWLKIVPALALLSVLVSTTLGVNYSYGLTPTLGLFLGIPTSDVVKLPAVSGEAKASIGNLASSWVAPADMPATGQMGRIKGGIPATNSHFGARQAEIWLPPAALVKNPPKLPLIIWMMGKPGSPDPQFIARELEAFAKTHNGLAPIVIAVDQLGSPTQDPLCIDSAKAKVETYFTQDVVPWARTHLNVTTSAADWMIAGYSNGGACAAYFGAKYPSTWANIMSISGEEYQGFGDGLVGQRFFNGNQAAYEAIKPIAVMQKGTYDHAFAVFTTGSQDSRYGPGQKKLGQAAEDAGMDVEVIELPGIDHTNDALVVGLQRALASMLPHLGL
jgi:enterochelin esterase-like enzyme